MARKLEVSTTLRRLPRKVMLDTSLQEARRSPELPPLSRLSPRSPIRQVLVRTYRYEELQVPGTPLPPKPPPKVFKCSWRKLPYQEGRPQVREGTSMVECCGSLYLYGGLSTSVLSDMYVLRPGSRAWEPVTTTGLESECRYGHSLEQHGSMAVLFGGAINANPKTQIRECFNTVRFLRPTGDTGAHWTLLRTNGCVVEMRRYHSASVVGKQMLVIGGLNQKNKVLDDCAVLDLHTGTWTLKELSPSPLAIACHTAVTVLDPQTTATSLLDLSQGSGELKLTGIYLFGGMDGKGACTNELCVLKPNSKGDLERKVVEASGQPPAPRCLHSMVLSRANSALVVFGGKSQETRVSAAAVYKDLHVLELTSLHWSQVSVFGNLPQARWAHSAGTLQDKIVLFGGIEFNLFSSNETFLLSLSCDSLQTEGSKVEPRSKSTSRIKVRQRTYIM